LQPDLSKEKSKMKPLTIRQTEPPFQDAREITDISVMATVSLHLNSLPSLFLTVSDATFKDVELRQMQDESHTVRTPRGYMTIPDMAFYVRRIIYT
jgi:hypothetical protein